MPFHAYLAGAWRRAKVVWHWNGSAWVKASKAFIYNSGSFQQGYQKTVMTACGGSEFGGDYTFSWTLTGDLYGNYIKLRKDGFPEGLSQYDCDSYSTGATVSSAAPPSTWEVQLYDANNDLLSTFTVFF